MKYQIVTNDRHGPFEHLEWLTIIHLAESLGYRIPIRIFVYPKYTIIHSTAARYIVQPDGTYEREAL